MASQQTTKCMPILIGITGGIGSGKSYIAKALHQKGFAVYDCDKEAKFIIEHSSYVRKQIICLFGSKAYTDEGLYNRRWIAEQVFEDATLLQKLNAIVHPAVREDISLWAQRQGQPYVFVESAILFESGVDILCKTVICIIAPKEIRIQRAMLRDQSTREQVIQRIANQMTDEERALHSNIVIMNDGNTSINSMIEQIVMHIKGK